MYVHEEQATLLAVTKNLEDTNQRLATCLAVRRNAEEAIAALTYRLTRLEKALKTSDQLELPFGDGDIHANLRLP